MLAEADPVVVSGRYEVVRFLGEGRRGDAFLARELFAGAWRVLQIAPPGDGACWRFVQQARATSRLGHPNVLRVHDVLTVGGAAALVTELAVGGSVEGWVRRNGPVPARRAAEIARQCAQALVHAHGEGVVHGDVRAANLLLRWDGTVLLDGFTGASADAEPADDVRALGATVAWMCTTRAAAPLDALPRAIAPVVEACRGVAPDLGRVAELLREALALAPDVPADTAPLCDRPILPGPWPPPPGARDERVIALRRRAAATTGGLSEEDTQHYTPPPTSESSDAEALPVPLPGPTAADPAFRAAPTVLAAAAVALAVAAAIGCSLHFP